MSVHSCYQNSRWMTVCTNKSRFITLHNTEETDGSFFRKLLINRTLASYFKPHNNDARCSRSLRNSSTWTMRSRIPSNHESCKHVSPNPWYQYQNTRRHSTFKWLRAELGRSRHSSARSWRRNPWVGFQGREGSALNRERTHCDLSVSSRHYVAKSANDNNFLQN